MKAFIIIVIMVSFIHWCVNLKQGFECDFVSPYKCEAISAIGVFMPPASLITVYVTEGK